MKIFLLLLVWLVGVFFTWALCKTAGDADDRIAQIMEKRRHETDQKK